MNKENKESFFYQKNLNINNIKNLRLYINNPLNKIKPKKFLNNTVIRKKYTLISPSSISNNPNRKNHIIIKPESQNNNINDKKIFNYVNTDSEDNFSFEHPKVYIKLNSLKKILIVVILYLMKKITKVVNIQLVELNLKIYVQMKE